MPDGGRVGIIKTSPINLAAMGFGVILTGTKKEQDQFFNEAGVDGIADSGILDLMGTLSIRELMAVIHASDVVVSGSTGPAHLAAALGVQHRQSFLILVENQSPVRWKPLGNGFVVLPDVPTCEKCIYEACPYWDCLDRITVTEVMERIRKSIPRSF